MKGYRRGGAMEESKGCNWWITGMILMVVMEIGSDMPHYLQW